MEGDHEAVLVGYHGAGDAVGRIAGEAQHEEALDVGAHRCHGLPERGVVAAGEGHEQHMLGIAQGVLGGAGEVLGGGAEVVAAAHAVLGGVSPEDARGGAGAAHEGVDVGLHLAVEVEHLLPELGLAADLGSDGGRVLAHELGDVVLEHGVPPLGTVDCRADTRTARALVTAHGHDRGPYPWNTLRPSSSPSAATASWPRTELPAASRGGAKAPMPMTPGTTARMPPPTPDLAGMPVR